MSGLLDTLGRLHPALVHFPVALVTTALVAEQLYIARKREWFGAAARFMVAAAAWMSVPSAVAGFAAASGEAVPPALAGVFSVHRIAGVVVPGVVWLAYAVCLGARRSGQVWEQALYRVILWLAFAAVGVAAWYGGRLVHGA